VLTAAGIAPEADLAAAGAAIVESGVTAIKQAGQMLKS